MTRKKAKIFKKILKYFLIRHLNLTILKLDNLRDLPILLPISSLEVRSVCFVVWMGNEWSFPIEDLEPINFFEERWSLERRWCPHRWVLRRNWNKLKCMKDSSSFCVQDNSSYFPPKCNFTGRVSGGKPVFYS